MRSYIVIFFLVIACQNPPDDIPGFEKKKPSSADEVPEVCSSKTQYSIHKGASITWRVQKLTADDGESTLTGITGVEGDLKVSPSDWSDAKALLKLTGKTTQSGNTLRDARIEEWIFGKSAFQFALTGIKGNNTARIEGESQVVTVLGILTVAGQKAEIEMPALLQDTKEMVTVTAADNFKLALNVEAPSINAINLAAPIEKLLALVPGVSIKDEIALDFSLELFPSCDPNPIVIDKGSETIEPVLPPPVLDPALPEKDPAEDLPDLTPDEPETLPETPDLGLTLYNERCAACHLPYPESNRRGIKAVKILDLYVKNFPTHSGVVWPNEEEAHALEKALK